MRYRHRLRLGFVGLAALGLGSLLWLSADPVPEKPSALGELRIAPNPLPPGATEVLIGRAGGIPQSLRVAATSADLVVEATEFLSRETVRVRFAAAPNAGEGTLQLNLDGETLDIKLGGSGVDGPLAVAANLPAELLRKRAVEVRRPVFTYAFVPAEGVELASVCIFNEATARWHQRDVEPAPLAEQTARGVRPDFLGVELAPGANRLLIASFTRAGISQLEEFVVSYIPPEEKES